MTEHDSFICVNRLLGWMCTDSVRPAGRVTDAVCREPAGETLFARTQQNKRQLILYRMTSLYWAATATAYGHY